MRDSIIYLGVFLMVVCVASATSLAMTHRVTNPLILQHQEATRAAAMAQVLPEADDFEDATEDFSDLLDDPDFADIVEVNVGLRQGDPVGNVITVAPTGYVDEIVTMVGISDGTITGVSILRQIETPGLGARVVEEDFKSQFLGLSSTDTVALKNDGGQIDALAGATESSRAVADGVDQATRLYERIRKER